MIKIEEKIQLLQKAIDANSGKVPEEWTPLIEFIEFALKFIKIFTRKEMDALIDGIIEAIEEYKRSNNV